MRFIRYRKEAKVKLSGDPEGVEELKKINQERKDYLKYLITEAKTNTDLSTTFKSLDGTRKYKITYDRMNQELTVAKI
jgi:hypothetical protein